jgi:hypothetical protein
MRVDAAHTGGVEFVDAQTWISLGALLVGGVTLYLALRGEARAGRRELAERMDRMEQRLEKRIDHVASDLGARIDTLDGRTYDLASGLGRRLGEERSSA